MKNLRALQTSTPLIDSFGDLHHLTHVWDTFCKGDTYGDFYYENAWIQIEEHLTKIVTLFNKYRTKIGSASWSTINLA